MRRWVLTAVVALALGTALTVGLAEFLAVRAPVPLEGPFQGSVVLSSGERAPFLHWRQFGADLLKWHWYLIRDEKDALGYPIVRAPLWSGVGRRKWYNAPDREFFVNVRCELGAGWPMRSMRWCYAVKDPPGVEIFEPHWSGVRLHNFSSPPRWSLARFRALPLSPVPLGFAADTALYAAVFLVMGVGWTKARARLRVRRGRCPVCGYSLSGLPPGAACPECGKGVVS